MKNGNVLLFGTEKATVALAPTRKLKISNMSRVRNTILKTTTR
jgi:hypothetical protein